MRSFTGAERRARLARRHFLAASAGSMDQALADLVGLHATDPATPYLSLWARLPGFDVAELVRRIVRTTSTRSSTGISWPGIQPREIHFG